MIQKCENCGCEVKFPEGHQDGGKSWHWNDHLCNLALREAKRILEAENAKLREQVHRFEEFTQVFRDLWDNPSDAALAKQLEQENMEEG